MPFDALNPADLTVSFDQFHISAIMGWIESNGYKPHLIINTQYAGVVLPPQCMTSPDAVINGHSNAVSKMTWSDLELGFNARFGGRDFRLKIPYRSIKAMQFAGTDLVVPLPWAIAPTVSVEVPEQTPVAPTMVEEIEPLSTAAKNLPEDETNVVRAIFGQPHKKQ